MRLPFTTGGSPFGGSPSPATQVHEALRELQGEGGYSEDEASLRDRELASLATAPGLALHTLWRAAAQAWPQLATEELDGWERAYSLREDASRNQGQRQARIVAAERAIGGASAARLQAALDAVVDGAVVHSPTAQQVDDLEASDGHIAQPFVALTDAQYRDRVTRTAVLEVLRRQLPAQCWGQDGVARVDDALGCFLSAEWASPTGQVGRDGLALDGAAATPLVNPPARLRDYGPASKLRAADLNAVQEALLASPCDGGSDAFGTAEHGQEIRPFSGVVTGTPLEWSGIDWRDRFIVFSWAASTTDIRPGGDPWPENAAAGLFKGTELLYTGTGTSGSFGTTFYGGNLEFYVDNSDGHPIIARVPASGTIYVVGYFIVTQDLDRR